MADEIRNSVVGGHMIYESDVKSNAEKEYEISFKI